MFRLLLPAALGALAACSPILAQGGNKAAAVASTAAATPQGKGMPFKAAKLAAIEAWLTANPKATDRTEALTEAAALAFDMSRWAQSKQLAESYLSEFPEGEAKGEMLLVVARSLGNIPGQEAAAVAGFEKAIAAAGDDINGVVMSTAELADLHCNAGNKEQAKKVLSALTERFPNVQGLSQFLDGKLGEIDELGVEPKPIDVTGIDGKPIKLADYKGKVLLIDFWATWCGPCVAELPNVIATYKQYHAAGFEVLGISLDDDESKLKAFLAKHDMPWPQFFDGKGWKNEIGQLYGVQSIPKTYLLDRAGKVRRVGIRGEALGREVGKLLAEKTK